ncbi:MAG: ABC transporter permease subunit [Candidatus Bathyarchaeota archaeon]|nr:ABC transporter permease subunit [Candidatus Bathyarchaeota archaeon]
MLALITRTINVKKLSLLIYIIISVALVWLFVVFFPSLQKQGEEFSSLLESYPEPFLKAFGVEKNLLFSFEAFLAAENFSLMWPILLIVLAITLGSSAIAGEIDQGTIEVLLSQPISRAKIYWAKYVSGFFIILIFIAASIFSVIPLARLHNVEIELQNYFMLFSLGTLFALAIFSLTMMFSSIFSIKGRSASLVAGILIFMYAINIVSQLRESVESLKYLSFLHYYDFSGALVHNQIEPLTIWFFLGISLFCTLTGLIVFIKRDIST